LTFRLWRMRRVRTISGPSRAFLSRCALALFPCFFCSGDHLNAHSALHLTSCLARASRRSVSSPTTLLRTTTSRLWSRPKSLPRRWKAVPRP
jgi:hypothetical protein